MGPSDPVVDLLQIGARRHYAVPLMMHQLGLLRQFHTDVYVGSGSWLCLPARVLRHLGVKGAIRRMSDRLSSLPGSKVHAHNLLGLRASRRLRAARDTMARMHVHHWLSREVNAAYLRSLRVPASVTIGFRGSDSLFEGLRGRSKCLLDQFDGGIHEVMTVRSEQARHRAWLTEDPDWVSCERDGKPWWLDIEGPRLRREWELADHIVCNSEWTRSCLVAEGVPVSKCTVIPLAYDGHSAGPGPRPKRSSRGPLRVAFLGTLTMRKGAHLLCEAARLASQEVAIEVVCAGATESNFSVTKLREYEPQVRHLGVIPRSQVPEFLRGMDVLALPSVSEGFGIVQLEAMGQGLPVIASERTGEVVEDGVNGLRVRAGDVESLAQAMVRLAKDRELLGALSAQAPTTLAKFSMDVVAAQWDRLVRTLATG